MNQNSVIFTGGSGLLGQEMKKLLRSDGTRVKLNIKNRQDFRTYKVTGERATTTSGLVPTHSVADTIEDLHAHQASYGDYSRDDFYNILTFRKLQF